MTLNNVTDKGMELVKLNGQFKRQWHFCLVMLELCSGNIAIPVIPEMLPVWAVGGYIDAEGGFSGTPRERRNRSCTRVRGGGGFKKWTREVNNGSYT